MDNYEEETPYTHLWDEYGEVFENFDDLALARWMCQTLGQMEGRSWRMSHPLVAAYRLCARISDKRQVWLKRLATPPVAYPESECCRAPLLPLLTREVRETGLFCAHCSRTLIPFDEIPQPLRTRLDKWAQAYNEAHNVAHWDDQRRMASPDYDEELESAAKAAEDCLRRVGTRLGPMLLEHYPAIVWEDSDECLEVRPEDVRLKS